MLMGLSSAIFSELLSVFSGHLLCIMSLADLLDRIDARIEGNIYAYDASIPGIFVYGVTMGLEQPYEIISDAA